jgi:selenium metabolism protein YedF
MKTIDCRNLVCPVPVVTVKNALKQDSEIKVLLDDGAPRENVARFARNRGFNVQEERDGDGWLLVISSTADASLETAGSTVSSEVSRELLITSERLGEGPEELGKLLMKNFIHTLLEAVEPPSRIFFMNSGVLLAIEGSEVYEALEKLRGMGVEILSCGLCLDYFGLKEKPRIGNTTNMLTAVESLLSSNAMIKV